MSNAAHPMGFWIGAKGGLIDAKHVERMHSAVWLFLYLLLRQTTLNASGEGVVNYGHPLTLDTIRSDTKGISVRKIHYWIGVLRRTGYIRTVLHGPQGISFWIAKGKHKTKLKRVSADKLTIEPRQPIVAIQKGTRQRSVTIDPESRQNPVPSIAAGAKQTLGFGEVTAETAASITKGFTSKDFSLSQQRLAAHPAAQPITLLGNFHGNSRGNPANHCQPPTEQELVQRQQEQKRRLAEYLKSHSEFQGSPTA